jgi:hypothetical protein
MGVFLVMLLLGYAIVQGRGELYGVSLGALVLLALATIAVFYTGFAAEDALMEVPDIDDKLVGAHKNAAKMAFTGMCILGGIALVVWWFGRKLPHISRGTATLVFLLTVAETVLMARAANLGGDIRHPEIRTGAAVETPYGKGEKE